MGQIRTRIKTAKPQAGVAGEFERSLEQELLSYTFELAGLLNNGLTFADNFKANTLDVADTGVINTEFAVAHTLKRVPVGYIVVGINKAAVVYNSGTAWTVSNIYLKANVANCTVKLIVF